MGWRKRQQGQVARKQYIDLVGAQKHWGQEKLTEHESNKSRLHEPVSIRPSLLRSALYKVSRPDPAKDKPELCEPAECRPAHGNLRIACGRMENKEVVNDIQSRPGREAETTVVGVDAAEETTATVNPDKRTGDAGMHKRRRTNPTPDHVPCTKVWHRRPTQTGVPKLAPRKPPAKRQAHKRTREAAEKNCDTNKQVNKRPADSEIVSSESCKTKQAASMSANFKGRRQTSSRDIRSFFVFGQSREAHKAIITGQAEQCTLRKRDTRHKENQQKGSSLKGLCWNVRGLTTVLHELAHLVEQHTQDFVILTETKLRKSLKYRKKLTEALEDYVVHTSCKRNTPNMREGGAQAQLG